MTRAPLRGGDLSGVDLVLASHKHSDHLDPGTLPDLLAASPEAELVLPEALVEHAVEPGPARRPARRPRRRADASSAPGFRVRAIPSAHEGLDTRRTAAGILYLGFVIESEGLRLYHSGDTMAVRRAGRAARGRAVRRAVPADQRPRPRAGRPGQHVGGRGRRPGREVRPAVRRPASLRHVHIQHGSGRRLRGRGEPAAGGDRRRGSCGAASAGRSRREHHAGHRRRHVGDQDAGDRRDGDDPRLGVGRVPVRAPRPGWSEQDPELWWDATVETVCDGAGAGEASSPPTSPGSASAARCTARSSSMPTGEVIRPALLWNDQRTAAECAEIEERAGGREALVRMVGEPGADRLHRAQAALGPQARAGELGPGPPGAPAQGLHPLPADGDLRHRGQRRLGDAPARRRQPPMEPGAARQARPRPRAPARLLREPRGLGPGERAGLEGDRPGRRGRRSSAAAATSRPARSATGSSGRASSRRRWGPRASSSPTPTELGFDPLGRLQRGCHAVPGRLARHGRGARGRRQLPVVPQRAGQGRGRAGPAAGDRPLLPPDRRGRAGRRRAPRGCSSCPT